MRNPMVIQVHPQTSRCRVHTSWCVLIIIISAFSQGTQQQQTCFHQPCFARNCCLYRPRTFCMVRMDSWYPAMPLWQLREVALQTPIKSSSVQQLLVKMLKAYASPSFRVSRSSMYIWSLGLTLNINKPLAVVEPASLQKPSTKYCPANTNSSRSLAEIHVPLSWRIRKKLFTWVVANLSTSSSMSPCRSWRKHILMEVISSFETRTPLYTIEKMVMLHTPIISGTRIWGLICMNHKFPTCHFIRAVVLLLLRLPPVSPRPCLHQLPPPLPPCRLFAKLFANFRAQCALLDLNTWDLPSSVRTAGPQPGTFPAQCAPLDLNLGPSRTAGLQPRTFPPHCAPLDLNLGPSELSAHSWTSTWDLPSSVRTAQCAPLDLNGQIECQKICQIECQIECQKICQIKCHKICQIECQKICQIGC